MTNYQEQAERRVEDSPELALFRDILIDYEWDNQEEHLEWVATGPFEDVLDWAESIRNYEEEQN